MLKHYYLKDRTGLYPGYPKPETTKLILTEAIIDTATLLQIQEIKAEYEILSCYGTNGLTEEHKQAIKELNQLKEIVFFFDGDKAGTEAIKKYKEFKNELPGIKLTAVETPEGEDINSLSVAYDNDIFTHLLENRKTLETPGAGELSGRVPEHEPVGAQAGRLNTHNPEYITFTTETLQIILLGGINLHQLDRLRVTIKISRTVTRDPVHSIRHTLDLYHADYLEKFIEKVSEKLETPTSVLNRTFAQLIDEIEKYRLSKIESQKEQRPKRKELSEEQKRKAIAYLQLPNLLERTNSDIGRTGMIGEENNRL
jgi:DNA primase